MIIALVFTAIALSQGWTYSGFMEEPSPPQPKKEPEKPPATPVPEEKLATSVPFPRQDLPGRFLPGLEKPKEEAKPKSASKGLGKPKSKVVVRAKVSSAGAEESVSRGWYPLASEPGVEAYGVLDEWGRVVVEQRRYASVPVLMEPVWWGQEWVGGFSCPGGMCR